MILKSVSLQFYLRHQSNPLISIQLFIILRRQIKITYLINRVQMVLVMFIMVNEFSYSQTDTIFQVQPPQIRSISTLNPNISVIGDFQSSWRNRAEKNFTTSLNEVEFSFQSVIDPFARADIFLALENDPETGEFKTVIEEGYLTTLSLPWHLQLKVGKFKNKLGRLNQLHSHALPMIQLPLVYENYLGEGLSDEGLSLSWLIPNPLFYQELVVEVTDGPGESPSFTRSDKNKYLRLAHLKNFWDLSPNATLEFGLTGIIGVNDSSRTTKFAALDLTYKFKPLQLNTYKSLTWQSELFYSNAELTNNSSAKSWGGYSLISVQLARRWFLTGRGDYSQRPHTSSQYKRSISLMLGWFTTEFQKLEMELKRTTSNFSDSFNIALVRWIFIIGVHGAHKY